MAKPFFLEIKQVSFLCLIMASVSVYLTMIEILGIKRASAYALSWLFTGFLAEYLYLSTDRFTHNEETVRILNHVPYSIAFNWLLTFFAIYSISTFFQFKIKSFNNKWKKLLLLLAMDSTFFTAYVILLDGIGNHAGYWTWNTEGASILVWGMVPLKVYFEYFIGIMLMMLPIRWFEVFKKAPSVVPFLVKISYPLYFGWSLYLVTTYWAFRKDIPMIGYTGMVIFIIITLLVIWQRKRLKNGTNNI